MSSADSERCFPAVEICIAPDLRQSPPSVAKDLKSKFKPNFLPHILFTKRQERLNLLHIIGEKFAKEQESSSAVAR